MKGKTRNYLIKELIETEVVLKNSTKQDERLMAYGAGLLAVKMCAGLNLLRESELDVWEQRFTKLMKGEENG